MSTSDDDSLDDLDQLPMNEGDAVDVSASVIDLSALDPSKVDLMRARLWVLRRTPWGWPFVVTVAAKIAAAEPEAAFWLELKHDEVNIALLAATNGLVRPVWLKRLPHLVSRHLARTEEEAARIRRVLGASGADAGIADGDLREREVVGGELVKPLWPSSKTLEEGELFKGMPFADRTLKKTYYLPELLLEEVTRLASEHDRSKADLLEASYLKARDRLEQATSRADLPEGPPRPADALEQGGTDQRAVRLAIPCWLSLELERKAAELDSSQSRVVVAALLWGLAEAAADGPSD